MSFASIGTGTLHHLTSISNSSLRAVEAISSFENLCEKAREPRLRMQKWFADLSEHMSSRLKSTEQHGDDDLSSFGALQMAGFTVQILIYRALLRPVIDETVSLAHIKADVRDFLLDCQSCLQMMIEFMRKLDAKDLSTFWPSYMRTCFCYPGQFAFMLHFRRHESDLASLSQKMLITWRQILRTKAQSWPILRLATLTVDAIFWKKLDRLAESNLAVD